MTNSDRGGALGIRTSIYVDENIDQIARIESSALRIPKSRYICILILRDSLDRAGYVPPEVEEMTTRDIVDLASEHMAEINSSRKQPSKKRLQPKRPKKIR